MKNLFYSSGQMERNIYTRKKGFLHNYSGYILTLVIGEIKQMSTENEG